MFRHNILLAKSQLTGSNRVLTGSIRISPFFALSQKAHICLVTDEILTTKTRIKTGLRKSYQVAVIKKTATYWYEHLILYIMRSLYTRGRIALIER